MYRYPLPLLVLILTFFLYFLIGCSDEDAIILKLKAIDEVWSSYEVSIKGFDFEGKQTYSAKFTSHSKEFIVSLPTCNYYIIEASKNGATMKYYATQSEITNHLLDIKVTPFSHYVSSVIDSFLAFKNSKGNLPMEKITLGKEMAKSNLRKLGIEYNSFTNLTNIDIEKLIISFKEKLGLQNLPEKDFLLKLEQVASGNLPSNANQNIKKLLVTLDAMENSNSSQNELSKQNSNSISISVENAFFSYSFGSVKAKEELTANTLTQIGKFPHNFIGKRLTSFEGLPTSLTEENYELPYLDENVNPWLSTIEINLKVSGEGVTTENIFITYGVKGILNKAWFSWGAELPPEKNITLTLNLQVSRESSAEGIKTSITPSISVRGVSSVIPTYKVSSFEVTNERGGEFSEIKAIIYLGKIAKLLAFEGEKLNFNGINWVSVEDWENFDWGDTGGTIGWNNCDWFEVSGKITTSTKEYLWRCDVRDLDNFIPYIATDFNYSVPLSSGQSLACVDGYSHLSWDKEYSMEEKGDNYILMTATASVTSDSSYIGRNRLALNLTLPEELQKNEARFKVKVAWFLSYDLQQEDTGDSTVDKIFCVSYAGEGDISFEVYQNSVTVYTPPYESSWLKLAYKENSLSEVDTILTTTNPTISFSTGITGRLLPSYTMLKIVGAEKYFISTSNYTRYNKRWLQITMFFPWDYNNSRAWYQKLSHYPFPYYIDNSGNVSWTYAGGIDLGGSNGGDDTLYTTAMWCFGIELITGDKVFVLWPEKFGNKNLATPLEDVSIDNLLNGNANFIAKFKFEWIDHD